VIKSSLSRTALESFLLLWTVEIQVEYTLVVILVE